MEGKYTVKEFAEITHRSRQTIRKQANSGRLKEYAHQVKGVMTIDAEALTLFFDKDELESLGFNQAQSNEPKQLEQTPADNPEQSSEATKNNSRQPSETTAENPEHPVEAICNNLGQPQQTTQDNLKQPYETTVDNSDMQLSASLEEQIRQQAAMITWLQNELSEERKHSRQLAEQLAVIADQSQKLQLVQMQPVKKLSFFERLFRRKNSNTD